MALSEEPSVYGWCMAAKAVRDPIASKRCCQSEAENCGPRSLMTFVGTPNKGMTFRIKIRATSSADTSSGQPSIMVKRENLSVITAHWT